MGMDVGQDAIENFGRYKSRYGMKKLVERTAVPKGCVCYLRVLDGGLFEGNILVTLDNGRKKMEIMGGIEDLKYVSRKFLHFFRNLNVSEKNRMAAAGNFQAMAEKKLLEEKIRMNRK